MIQYSGNLVIIGEAASPYHAWMVGALESAVHVVDAWLGLNLNIPGAEAARAALRDPDPKLAKLFGLPAYTTRNASNWESLCAMKTREDHLHLVKENVPKSD